MKPIAWLSCAAVSLALAGAATRPRYGGTLRVELAEGMASLDPAAAGPAGVLLFDTLVRLDDRARPVPALAASWTFEPKHKRWIFRLRPGVTFSDGSPLTADDAAAAIPRSTAVGDSLEIEPRPDLFATLAAAPVARQANGQWIGSGPFRVTSFRPDAALSLAASETHWGGRPFLDRIEILFRRSGRDRFAGLDLGRAEAIEIQPDDVRRASSRQFRVTAGPNAELLCLVFAPGIDARLREAVALSIDRAAIHNVLLARQGEITGALLPQWLSGYAFLFPAAPDLARAKQRAAEAPKPAAPISLVFDGALPLARLIADRIALNARDAGVAIRTAPAGTAPPEIALVRVPAPSIDASFALTGVARALGLSAPAIPPDSPETLFAAELALLEDCRVVPLFHLPVTWVLSPRVRNWRLTRHGEWRLAGVWLDTEQEKPRP